MTLVERLKAYLQGHPFEVYRGLQEWNATPRSALVWAWFAQECDVYEAVDSLDPIALARAEGRREAFHMLRDLATADGRDILEIQRAALREGGEG